MIKSLYDKRRENTYIFKGTVMHLEALIRHLLGLERGLHAGREIEGLEKD